MSTHHPILLGLTTRDGVCAAFDLPYGRDIPCRPTPRSNLFVAADGRYAALLAGPTTQAADLAGQRIMAFNAIAPHGPFAVYGPPETRAVTRPKTHPETPGVALAAGAVDAQECLTLLRDNRKVIGQILDHAGGVVQFDVSLTPRTLGDTLTNEERQDAVSLAIHDLCEVALDWRERPSDNVNVAAMSFAVTTPDAWRFETALTAIRKAHSHALRLRGQGPLPAADFVSWALDEAGRTITAQTPAAKTSNAVHAA